MTGRPAGSDVPAPDPDLAVLRRVAAGEADAFAELVERHQARLLRLCARLLRDSDEAQDAAQEVFLRAYRSAASYEPRGQVFTWLYRIAVNYCFNRLRRRKLVQFLSLRRSGPADEVEEIDPPDEAPGFERTLAARESWRAMRVAIAALPANQQTVLMLAKFEQLSYREIAGALGITEGAVESRLVRAMRSLQRAQETAGGQAASQERSGSGVSPRRRG